MDTSLVRQSYIVPWAMCPPKVLTWQQDMVRRSGYCPLCENLSLEIIGPTHIPGRRGWPRPYLKATQASAVAGCRTCSFIVNVIEDFGLYTELVSTVHITESEAAKALGSCNSSDLMMLLETSSPRDRHRLKDACAGDVLSHLLSRHQREPMLLFDLYHIMLEVNGCTGSALGTSVTHLSLDCRWGLPHCDRANRVEIYHTPGTLQCRLQSPPLMKIR